MRIIGGTAKRRIIQAPKGKNTRPTQDYIREALFNIIQIYTPDSVCLDLFAGSGALGLEALSRGAKYCLFCDKDRASFTQIQENIQSLGFDDRSLVLKHDWKIAINDACDKNIKFDLVFIDPPYKLGDIDSIFKKLVDSFVLNKNAIIIIERDKNSEPMKPDKFSHITHKEYGITAIDIYRFEAENE